MVRPAVSRPFWAGNFVKNPLHQVARANADEVRQFARELGLSPSARVGLRIEPERAHDRHRSPAVAPGGRARSLAPKRRWAALSPDRAFAVSDNGGQEGPGIAPSCCIIPS